MQQSEQVAIFWDIENLPPRTGVSGYETVETIRQLAHEFGSIVSFKAYLELSSTLRLWSELQASGVSLVDCPHNGSKDVSDKMLLVDMIAFAIDHPPPATIFLISSDHAFAYGLSILRHRRYNVVVLCPSDTHQSLLAQATHLHWHASAPDEFEVSEPPPTPPPPASRTPRHQSHSVRRGSTPSDVKGKGKKNDDDDIDSEDGDSDHHQRLDGHRHADPNSFGQTAPWRSSSRATSRPFSPVGSFRSAHSSPPTPPPNERRSVEPTLVTNGDIVFQSSSQQPELPRGFPFAEADLTPLTKELRPSGPALVDETARAQSPVHVSPVTTSAPAPSWNSSTPAFVPTGQPSRMTPTPATPPLSSVRPSVTEPSAAAAGSTVVAPVLPAPKPPTVKPMPPTPARPTPKTAPLHFLPLIAALERRSKTNGAVMRTDLGSDLAKVTNLYARAKVSKFSSYILLAENAGIVSLGGSGSTAWVSLRPEWSSSARFPSSM